MCRCPVHPAPQSGGRCQRRDPGGDGTCAQELPLCRGWAQDELGVPASSAVANVPCVMVIIPRCGSLRDVRVNAWDPFSAVHPHGISGLRPGDVGSSALYPHDRNCRAFGEHYACTFRFIRRGAW